MIHLQINPAFAGTLLHEILTMLKQPGKVYLPE
jgi:hypothetical protein